MKTSYTVIINTLAIFIISLTLISCASIRPARQDAVWIDVRTPGEYARGHVDKAVNIPYQDIGKRITEITNNKDQKIIVYCASGHRAGIARETLLKQGYTDVTNAGGYRDIIANTNHADEAQSHN